MVNRGLVIGGAIITAFALVFLNPIFEIPDLAAFNGPLPVDSSLEWTVIAVVIFMVVFLTGSGMMAKGFLERKLIKSVATRTIGEEAA